MIFVKLSRTDLSFSSAHFILIGGKCEHLHGHNYSIEVKVEGIPDENGVIIDFIKLKNIIRNICNNLDHRVLLPKKSNYLTIKEHKRNVIVEVGAKKYLFPKEDVVFLPIKASSTEEIARYFCEEIISYLPEKSDIRSIEVTVEEKLGQGATYTKDLT